VLAGWCRNLNAESAGWKIGTKQILVNWLLFIRRLQGDAVGMRRC
jgi:hypothetical protein